MTDPRLAVRRAERNARDEDAAARLMTDYLQWALSMMAKEGVVFPGSFDSKSVRASLGKYFPPTGRLLLAERGEVPIGVGALRSLDEKKVEIKRMYVLPEARGLHAGSRLVDGLVEEARALKASTILLDSAWFMTQAHRLYLSRGFIEREAYEGTEIPSELWPRWRFFEKDKDEG